MKTVIKPEELTVDEFKEKLKRELKNASIWNNPMVNDYNAKAVNEFIDKL